MQASRRQLAENTLAVGATGGIALITPTDPREEMNYHNIWGSFTVEVETADANAQGTWVLYILRENATVVGWTDTIFNNETNNAVIIACGVWSASNQSSYTSPFINPKTSRTLQAGDRIILATHVSGVSAGSCSVRQMLCAHVTRK